MEVRLLASSGLPSNAVVQLRAATTRRQAKVGTPVSYEFATPITNTVPLKVEAFEPICAASVTLSPDAERYNVKFPVAADGVQSSLQLHIGDCTAQEFREKHKHTLALGDERSAEAAVGPRHSPENSDESASKKDSHALARDYLERYDLVSFVQSMLGSMLREQPSDPWKFMADRARSSGGLPPQQDVAEESPVKAEDKPPAPATAPTDGWLKHSEGEWVLSTSVCMMTRYCHKDSGDHRFDLLLPSGRTVTISCTDEQFKGLLAEQGSSGLAETRAAINQMFCEGFDEILKASSTTAAGAAELKPEQPERMSSPELVAATMSEAQSSQMKAMRLQMKADLIDAELGGRLQHVVKAAFGGEDKATQQEKSSHDAPAPTTEACQNGVSGSALEAALAAHAQGNVKASSKESVAKSASVSSIPDQPGAFKGLPTETLPGFGGSESGLEDEESHAQKPMPMAPRPTMVAMPVTDQAPEWIVESQRAWCLNGVHGTLTTTVSRLSGNYIFEMHPAGGQVISLNCTQAQFSEVLAEQKEASGPAQTMAAISQLFSEGLSELTKGPGEPMSAIGGLLAPLCEEGNEEQPTEEVKPGWSLVSKDAWTMQGVNGTLTRYVDSHTGDHAFELQTATGRTLSVKCTKTKFERLLEEHKDKAGDEQTMAAINQLWSDGFQEMPTTALGAAGSRRNSNASLLSAFGEEDASSPPPAQKAATAQNIPEDAPEWILQSQEAWNLQGAHGTLTTLTSRFTGNYAFEMQLLTGQMITINCTEAQFEAALQAQTDIEGPAKTIAAINKLFLDGVESLKETGSKAAAAQEDPEVDDFGEDDGVVGAKIDSGTTSSAKAATGWVLESQRAWSLRGIHGTLTTMTDSSSGDVMFELQTGAGQTLTINCTQAQFDGVIAEQKDLKGPAQTLAAIEQLFSEALQQMSTEAVKAALGEEPSQPVPGAVPSQDPGASELVGQNSQLEEENAELARKIAELQSKMAGLESATSNAAAAPETLVSPRLSAPPTEIRQQNTELRADYKKLAAEFLQLTGDREAMMHELLLRLSGSLLEMQGDLRSALSSMQTLSQTSEASPASMEAENKELKDANDVLLEATRLLRAKNDVVAERLRSRPGSRAGPDSPSPAPTSNPPSPSRP
eukprot:TRINITY_DN74175_c0_g1_i1.p1 TRINITY_DN74175_c0_g1~~TRINITY_DN74175_c0_g1_i1.p1  ORF type:complete len:1136 (+),score=289.71 TRINITY_DN74175_c0_g1_i1:147-3554(+)